MTEPEKRGYHGWYLDDMLHHETLPARHFANGHQEYRQCGMLHRLDGPAIIYADGYVEFFLNGVHLTEEEFNLQVSLINPPDESEGDSNHEEN